MKKLYFIIISLLITCINLNAQQSFESLSDYIEDNGGIAKMLEDPASFNYVNTRCAGYFLFYAGAVQNLDDGKLTNIYADKAIQLTMISTKLDIALNVDKTKDLKIITDNTNKKILDISKLYRADMDKNYITTGENIIDTYLEDERDICDDFYVLMQKWEQVK